MNNEELSRLVAEYVMGWKPNCTHENRFEKTSPEYNSAGWICPDCGLERVGFEDADPWGGGSFSITNPAHSDMIIDKIVDDPEVELTIFKWSKAEWNVEITKVADGQSKRYLGCDHTKHRAIAKAALRAKGVEVNE